MPPNFSVLPWQTHLGDFDPWCFRYEGGRVKKESNRRNSFFLFFVGGGFKYFWNVHPEIWGNDPI